MDKIKAILAQAATLLTGEPARFIGYGAAIVIVGVVAIANALGFTRFGQGIDLPTALGLSGTAITLLVTVIEGIRHYVFSPNTVAVLTATVKVAPATPGPATPVPNGAQP